MLAFFKTRKLLIVVKLNLRAPDSMTKKILLLFLFLNAAMGCSISPITSSQRFKAKKQPSFSLLATRPSAFIGQHVLLGGIIQRCMTQEGESLMLIIQKPLDRATDKPIMKSPSQGKFYFWYKGKLDPKVYSTGKMITISGQVVSPFKMKMDSSHFLIVEGEEFFLWPKESLPAYAQKIPTRSILENLWEPVGFEPWTTGWGEGWW
ncbi:Starvation-inducible outer membrane lipoprotein [Methylacidiphilum infernorum V4]|uniref:Starvation-inducible outer membrane lipoprotein n=2 Tax=Candidatus Methylacidiphilum infernorum TaxID=511746 RepID=B3DUL4_METI4|nr:Starvation-inducible outer membrane lipoprotein [Methylacidiphilum infernorum V4]